MKAVIYARFSCDRQREESIDGQIRDCQKYAKENGITIVGTYIDRALSAAKETEKRLDFLKMIQDSAKHTFDFVLVWKLDRFARNRYDSAHYKNMLKKNGVKVISATERITEGAEGIILESVLEGMAEYYSADLSEKIRRGQKENALKCQNNGARVPFGYRLVNHHLEPDPETAPVALELFKRYAEGESIKALVDDLNSRGIKTRLGNDFTYSSFSALFKNRTYIGEFHYSDIVTPGGIEAIVPQEIFDRVQARMEKNKLAPARAKAEEGYLLTTKLFCGECGGMMAGESGAGRYGKVYRYYKCSHAKRNKGCHKKAVKKEWIEDLVVKQTMGLVMDKSLMGDLVDKLVELQGAESYDLKLLEKQLAEVSRGIENMLNAIQDGIVTPSTKQRLSDLEEQHAQLEQSISKEQINNPVLSREEIECFLDRFKKTDVEDEGQRQRLIDCFVNAVYVYDDKIVLTFNYKDGTKTIGLKEIDGSDLVGNGPPKGS